MSSHEIEEESVRDIVADHPFKAEDDEKVGCTPSCILISAEVT